MHFFARRDHHHGTQRRTLRRGSISGGDPEPRGACGRSSSQLRSLVARAAKDFMVERNWAQISSGATFELLVTTLVFFEDPGAALFGRRGKDGGQDARSSRGNLVYQAKHHTDGSAAKAIADALKEAKKIAGYRTPGDGRFREWSGITDWRLVTNATFNPKDHQAWLDDVVPVFKRMNLNATYWERANLDALLDKYPEVNRSFFGNEPRVFLAIPEVRERLPAEEPFLPRASASSFIGRTAEVEQIRQFIEAPQAFLVVHGAGGVGKTRLLIESADAIAEAGEWQVLWANVATMTTSGAWFDGVVPERPTVLCIDEPDDEQVLRLIVEQLGTKVGRAAKWKVILSVRSPKDPVISFLAAPRMAQSVAWLLVDRLSKEAAQTLTGELLASGPSVQYGTEWIERAAAEFVSRFGPHPIWLTLAVHAIETRGNLALIPQDAAGLADLYLDEIIAQQKGAPPEQVRDVLRWIALAGKLNRENDADVEVVASGSGIGDPTSALMLIRQLVERRALIQRGLRDRLVEIKPDVLRDHILSKWLAVDVGFGEQPLRPSNDARNLLDRVFEAIDRGLRPLEKSILTSIARTELLLRFARQPVALLDPFYQAVSAALPSATPSQLISFTEVLVEIARVRVLDTLDVSRRLRTTAVGNETTSTMFGKRTVTHDDVVLALGWLVYHAAMGATTKEERIAVLEELFELAKAEAAIGARRPRGLPNDGHRAAGLVGQTISGGKYFWTEFDDAIAVVATRALDGLKDTAPTPDAAQALGALVRPALAVERHQAWTEGNKFVWSKHIIMEGHPAWTARAAIVDRMRLLLQDDDIPSASRMLIWDLLADAHRLANYAALHGPEPFRERMRVEFLKELNWTYDVLERRGSQFEEVSAARDLWHWHAEHDKDEQTNAAALRLEALYGANQLAAEFEPLLEFESVAKMEQTAAGKAEQLAGGSAADIERFIERGIRFVGGDKNFHRLLGIGGAMGAHARTSAQVADFIANALTGKSRPNSETLDFALAAASRWFFVERSENTDRGLTLLRDLLNSCSDDLVRARLALEAYGSFAPRWRWDQLSADEHEMLRGQLATFRSADRLPWFVSLVGRAPSYKWEEYRALIDKVIDELREPRRTEAVASLIEAIFWTVHERSASEFPADLNVWLLDRVLRVRDFDALSNMLEWRLEQVIGVLGRVPLTWLPRALKQRANLEKQERDDGVRALSHDVGLSEFVAPIGEHQAEEPDVHLAVQELLEFVDDHGMVGYRLPDLLHEIDPGGIVVPKVLADRMAEGGEDAIKRFARLALAYVVGTEPWRAIATPVVAYASKLDDRERVSLFHTVAEPGVRSWSGTPGTVADVFRIEVDRMKAVRDAERDPRFIPLWDWCIDVVMADLRHQEARAKEWQENDEEP